MTTPSTLHLRVERPLTSGGHGVPWGGVDIDVHHDHDGLPAIRRSTLNARLRESCLEFLPLRPDLAPAALRLFGCPGQHKDGRILSVRDALLPSEVSHAVRDAVPGRITQHEALDGFTTVITTTAMTNRGGPARGSRRDVRAVRPAITFIAVLRWRPDPVETDVECLARAVLGLQQIGLGSSRGRGVVTASLDGDRAQTRTLAKITEGWS